MRFPRSSLTLAVLVNSLGFSVPTALAYNVIAGASVMLGGIVIMLADVSNLDTGMLLAYGAGNYIYCATVHMFSAGSKNILHDAKRLLAFAGRRRHRADPSGPRALRGRRGRGRR